MVILFKGTDKNFNYAPQALALCAGLSATKYLKKTLVLQLTTLAPIENFVIGKRMHEQDIADGSYLFEDSGMDSLTRRAGVTTFNADHFANAVTPAVSSENLFDILAVSKKVEADVEREILKDPTVVGSIIKSAKKIYDNIFILASGASKEVLEAVLPNVDKTVTCILQGQKEEITSFQGTKDVLLLSDYDYKSAYSKHAMAKLYGVKKIYTMPYNVEFKDFYTDENMLQYILKNTSPEKSDYSFHLIDDMSKLVKSLTEEEDPDEEEFRFTHKAFNRRFAPLKTLSGKNVKIEVTEKKFLKPSKKLVHVNTKKPFETEENVRKDA